MIFLVNIFRHLVIKKIFMAETACCMYTIELLDIIPLFTKRKILIDSKFLVRDKRFLDNSPLF